MSSSTTRTVPRAGQPHLDPVVAVVAATRGLPALAHRPGQPGGDQPVRRAVEEVAAAGDPAAVLEGREVDGAERLDRPRVGDDLAVHAQPGDAAVGVDREPHVGPAPAGRDGEDVRRCRPAAASARPAVAQSASLQRRRPTGARRRRPPRPTPRLGKLPVKWLVSTTTARTTPGAPSRTIASSRGPGRSRRRRVSQPSYTWPLAPKVLRREGRRPGVDEVLPAGEQLVVGPHHGRRRTSAARGPAVRAGPGRVAVLVHHASPLASSRPVGGPDRSASTGAPANHVAPHHAGEPRAGVRRHGVAVVQRRAGRPPARSSGAKATRSAAPPDPDRRPWWPARPAPRVPADIQRITSARSCPRRRASVQTSGSPSCSDEMPPQAVPKSPVSSALQVGGAGRVVADDEVDRAVGQPGPERLAVGVAAHRRAALERGRAVGHVLRPQHQVVRAGLDRHPHAVGLGGRERGQGAGAGQVHDVHPRARRARGRVDDGLDRAVLGARRAARRGSARSRLPVASVRRPARRGPRRAPSSSPSAAATSSHGAGSPAVPDSAGNSATPESGRKHLTPKTPASSSCRSRPALRRHRAAPEADVDDALPRGRGSLHRPARPGRGSAGCC